MAGHPHRELAPPSSEWLHLREPSRELWEGFLEGRFDRVLDPSPLLERWARSAALGASADGPAWPEGIAGASLRSRQAEVWEQLGETGQHLRSLEVQAALGNCIALVADPSGVILRTAGPGSVGGDVARSRLVEGAVWAESTRGTNAIGTALAERRPVSVLGRGHFEVRNHGLTCYAAPVTDVHGEVVAILDVTGARADDHPLLGVAVTATAHPLQSALRHPANTQGRVRGR